MCVLSTSPLPVSVSSSVSGILCSCSSGLRRSEPVSAPWIQFPPCTSSLLLQTVLPSGFQLGSAIGENRQEMREEAEREVGCDTLPPHRRLVVTSAKSCITSPDSHPLHARRQLPFWASGLCQLPMPAPGPCTTTLCGTLYTSAPLCKLYLFETFLRSPWGILSA